MVSLVSLGIDIDSSFSIDSTTNDISLVKDKDCLKQYVVNRLLTRVNELYHFVYPEDEYGNPSWDYLGELGYGYITNVIKVLVEMQCLNFEIDIAEINNVEVLFNDDNRNDFILTVDYIDINNSPDSINIVMRE